jgi:hypothetical protein
VDVRIQLDDGHGSWTARDDETHRSKGEEKYFSVGLPSGCGIVVYSAHLGP